MSAADTLIAAINAEINALPTGPYGEVIFDDDLFAGLPKPDVFLGPEPHVHQGPDNPLLRELAEHPTLLGSLTTRVCCD